MSLTKVLAMGLPIIKLIWGQISPSLKTAIEEGVTTLEAKAAETDAGWDDFLVQLLRWALTSLD